MAQPGEVEARSPWAEEEPHRLISLCGDPELRSSEAPASATTLLPQQPVSWLSNAAQSEQSRIPFGPLLQTTWAVGTHDQRVSDQLEADGRHTATVI